MPSAWKKSYHAARAPTLADDDAGATITGSTMTVEGCGADSLQGDVRFAEVMGLMGAQVQWQPFSITITGAPAAPLRLGLYHWVEALLYHPCCYNDTLCGRSSTRHVYTAGCGPMKQ